jgi:hypothetical protein
LGQLSRFPASLEGALSRVLQWGHAKARGIGAISSSNCGQRKQPDNFARLLAACCIGSSYLHGKEKNVLQMQEKENARFFWSRLLATEFGHFPQ